MRDGKKRILTRVFPRFFHRRTAGCLPRARPVRINLDRDVDMQITGHRHAFLAKYKAGATR